MLQQEFDLIKEFGLDNLPDEKKAALQTKLIELADSRFNRLILNRLNEAEKAEFDQVLAGGELEAMTNFMTSKVPDYAEIYNQVIVDLKSEMLDMRDALLKA